MFGYAGKVLFVDLTTGEFREEPLNEEWAHDFLGCGALGTRYLYDRMAPGTDPFSEESMVGFICGPCNGTPAFMSLRFMTASLSPVSKGINVSNCGGTFGPQLRRCGFDAVFFTGISPKPVYLDISDEGYELRDASHLWGKTTLEVEEILKEELGLKKVAAAMIGPGGEHLSWMASVMNDSHRAGGRGGTGAVIGFKNLKAVVPHGSIQPQVAHREDLMAANKMVLDWQKNGPLKELAVGFKQLGSGIGYDGSLLSGDCSVKNWSGSGVVDAPEEHWSTMSALKMDEKYRVKKYACNACPVGCGAIYKVDGKKYKMDDTGRPEYETAGGFGPMLANYDDTESVNWCNFLCNEYGFDTISAAGTIAWAMECFSDGILTLDDLDGIDLSWGNMEGAVAILEKMCKAEGVGAILMNGSRYACEHFGGRGADRLCTASGIELAMHDPRFAPMLARTLKYDATPGRHTMGGLGPNSGNAPVEEKFDYDALADKDIQMTSYYEVIHNGGFCMFTDWAYDPSYYRPILNAVTGAEYTDEDLLELGKRTWMLRWCFNLREGIYRKDYTLDERMQGIPPLEEGPLAGVTVDVEHIADNFFERMGCDLETGIPSKAALEKLGGLECAIADLYPEG